MTLKQFGELAGGAVVAYIFYSMSWPAIFRWPLVIIFAIFGFALAFLPIEERPLDVWIINFIKAIYQPTLYIWKKGAVPAVSPAPTAVTSLSTAPAAALPTTPVSGPVAAPQLWPFPKETPKPETKPAAPDNPPSATAPEPQKTEGPVPPATPQPSSTTPVSPTTPVTPSGSTATTPTPAAPATPFSIEDLQGFRDKKLAEMQGTNRSPKLPAPAVEPAKPPDFMTIDDLARRRDEKKAADQIQLHNLVEQNQKITDQIEGLKTRILALQGTDTSQLNAQVENLSKQKADLTVQINSLQSQIEGKPVTPPAAPPISIVVPPANQPAPAPAAAPAATAPAPAIALTDVPNIINGIIKNDRGVPVDNVILTIKDKSGNSIRALKTNPVGHFIASTPLEKGTYVLEFERQGYTFDPLEVTLENKVIPPLAVLAKAVGTA